MFQSVLVQKIPKIGQEKSNLKWKKSDPKQKKSVFKYV